MTFQKQILGPIHMLTQKDKWDYLRGPILENIFVSCFDIGEVPRSPGKWNWHRLSYLAFIFISEQCVFHKDYQLTTFVKPKKIIDITEILTSLIANYSILNIMPNPSIKLFQDLNFRFKVTY